MTFIKIRTSDNHGTDLTVEVLSIQRGAMKTVVITDQADQAQIMVYDDEIDNLIAALIQLKGEIQ